MPTQQFLKIKLCARDALGCSHEALLLFIINGIQYVFVWSSGKRQGSLIVTTIHLTQ